MHSKTDTNTEILTKQCQKFTDTGQGGGKETVYNSKKIPPIAGAAIKGATSFSCRQEKVDFLGVPRLDDNINFQLKSVSAKKMLLWGCE